MDLYLQTRGQEGKNPNKKKKQNKTKKKPTKKQTPETFLQQRDGASGGARGRAAAQSGAGSGALPARTLAGRRRGAGPPLRARCSPPTAPPSRASSPAPIIAYPALPPRAGALVEAGGGGGEKLFLRKKKGGGVEKSEMQRKTEGRREGGAGSPSGLEEGARGDTFL